MRLRFWLLDIDENIEKEDFQIRLWALDNKGKPIVVVDRQFLPNFYLIPDERHSIDEVFKAIKDMRLPEIASIELKERRYFGKDMDCIKITLTNPAVTRKLAASLTKLPGVKESLQDDLRYSYCYMVENQINPCEWHEVEIREAEAIPGIDVDHVYEAIHKPKALEPSDPPPLRVLAFSMICYSPRGAPHPSKSPAVIISCSTNLDQQKQFLAKNLDDNSTIREFCKYLLDFDPDIVVSYNGNRFEWPFLLERAKKLEIPLDVNRTSGRPHRSMYGHISITGRANLDLADLADEIGEIKVKTLENIASYLGLPEADVELIEEVEYPSYWEDNAKRLELLAFSERRSKIILGVAKEMLEFAEQLSSLSGLPLDQVGSAAVGFRTESYLIREATLEGELIPRRIERPYFPYQGAMVIKPDPGLHKNVVVFDFKSMYPNLMIVYNISFDTYVPSKEKVSTDQVYVAPKVGHRFRREPSGFYRKALSKLIQARKLVQAKLKQLKMGSVNYRLLDARQKAIKVMTNAAYGYAGWIGARWYLLPVAEATAAWGRELIGDTIALAKRLNLEVIYGDTDSVFIKHADNTERFLRETEEKFGLEVETEETYKRILFTEAKKRYAGLLEDNSINIVGLEVARGDWSEVAKKTQEETLSIILTEESPQKAAQYVQERILALRRGEIPYKELIIWKTLTKPTSAYRVRTPHVEAAKRLADEGWELSTGEKVGYVIVKGEGKLYQRAIPYAFASWKDVDTSYYEEQQIVPSILRILGMFDIKKQELFPSITQ